METATWELVNLVRASRGGCTDYRISKLLGVTTATVSGWKAGKWHMSNELIAKAAALANVNPFEWFLRIASQREGDAMVRRVMTEALADFEAQQRGVTPAPGRLFHLLTRGIAGSLAAVILAALGIVGGPQPAEARDVMPRAYVIDRVIYYAQIAGRFFAALRTRRKRARRHRPAVHRPAMVRA